MVDTERPKTNKPRDRVLSDDELAAVWRACGDDEYGKIIRLLILTGCRREEIGGMLWSEFTPDGSSWTLPAERAKNDNPLTLPEMPMMRALLDTVPKMASRDQLFGQRSHGFTAWSWPPNKAALIERSKVRDWTLHDIRRTVATKMVDAGVEPYAVEATLNHISGHRGGVAGIYNRSKYETQIRVALATWHDRLRVLLEQDSERKVLQLRAP